MSKEQNQYKFTEGEIHSFTITGFTEIPGSDESFFILKNSLGGKHLLKSEPFKHYHLQINQQLNCKIDKINCSGKIYLEPENPIYKESQIYEFEFVKTTKIISSVGEKEIIALVKDQFGVESICSLPKDCILSANIKKLQCKILRIKKGQLYLAIPEKVEEENTLNIGDKYWFTITDIKPLENQDDYYILKDEFQTSYSLKKEMYAHYGFQINQEVECNVTKYSKDGHLKIEPLHPFYEIGKSYAFKYLRTESEFNPLSNEEQVIIVEDFYGIETKVRSISLKNITIPVTGFINCKVEGIRKGKAILSLI